MQKVTISLREITNETASAISALKPTENQKQFVASNAASIIEAHSSPDYAWYRAIYADDIPVGFVMLGINPQEDFCFLWRFMIDAKYQKRGYGKTALALVIDEIKFRPNIKKIITSYREGDGNPGDFYREVGFREVDKIEEFGALGEKIKQFGEVPLEFKIQHNLKFYDITIPNPTFDKIVQDYEGLIAALDNAHDTDSRIAIVQRWDQIYRQFYTWCVFVEVKFKQDTANEQFRANLKFRDEMQPKVTELEIAIKRRFLKEPFRKDVEAKFKKHIIALWEADVLTYEPVIQGDLIVESKLTAQYTTLRSEAKLRFKETTYSLSGIQKFNGDLDRNVRHDCQKVMWNWFAENGEQLDSIFDELLMRRTDMARNLGYKNYIDLAYKKWKRVGYDQANIESLRKEVLKHVVPLTSAIMEKRRVRLGLEKLYVYDGGLSLLEGNPKPNGEHDFIIASAAEMFDDLRSEMGEFFRMLKNAHLMDLETRQNKSTPECFYLPDFEVPFVLSNFKGTMSDIEVFVHEMGHAFQLYCSRNQPMLEYQTPTWDSAEIHSTSLEFLTYPFMEKFFGDKGAKQYRQIHLENSLLFLPFGVAIDHFQHLVYANPKASSADRHAMWKEMESIYLPDWDWDDLTYPAKGGRWQLTQHIYTVPFFYIDYVLSSVCALQFWLRSTEDFSKSMDEYITLCKRGGEASFPDLIKSAGLSSPFDEGCLAAVVKRAYELLD